MPSPHEERSRDADFVTNPLVLRCVEVVELITFYLDDALDVNDRRAVDTHLRGCENCTVFVTQIRQTIQLAAAVGQREAVEPPANFAELSALVAQRNDPSTQT